MFRGLLAVAAALVLVLAGCGGGDDVPPAPPGPPTATAPTATVPTATVPPPAPTGPARTFSIPPPVTTPSSDGDTEQRTPTPSAAPLVVGAVDDAARHRGPVLGQLADAGFGALGITSFWDPGRSAPTRGELAVLRDTAARAGQRNLRTFLAVYHRGSATTPLTPAARGQFSGYVAAIVRGVPRIRDVIVGNEPNLNRFWLPQYGPDGSNAASPAYVELLAEVYDAAKAAAGDVRIWGGALAPRGSDRPDGIRPTQSPTAFIRGMGEALRASGRTRPLMDGFAFHPYPESSSTPPDLPHPNPRSRQLGLADVGRLQEGLREAFGRELPILYSELGVETKIPASKRSLYQGEEVASPIDEATQADFYRRALELASCQPGVVGLLLFHSHDEPALTGFQSGVHYVDGTPKSSLPAVRTAIEAARDGC